MNINERLRGILADHYLTFNGGSFIFIKREFLQAVAVGVTIEEAIATFDTRRPHEHDRKCSSSSSPSAIAWSSSGVGEQLDDEVRAAKYANAIRKHRDYRGDDRCYLDDVELYETLPEGYTPPGQDTEIDLNECARFKECRKNPATKYISQQRRIEELEAENRILMEHCGRLELKAMQERQKQPSKEHSNG